MKRLQILVFIFAVVVALTGCQTDVELNPNYSGGTYDVKTYEVFDGTLNGVLTPFWTDTYSCNPEDNFVYDATGAAYLNDDSTQVVCDPYIYNRTYADESDSRVPVVQ